MVTAIIHIKYINLLTPGLSILRFFTEKGTPVSVRLHHREVTLPPAGQKKSESTHYQTRQFAQGNIYLDVLQSLISSGITSRSQTSG